MDSTEQPLAGQLWPEVAGAHTLDGRDDLPVPGDDEANEVLLGRMLAGD